MSSPKMTRTFGLFWAHATVGPNSVSATIPAPTARRAQFVAPIITVSYRCLYQAASFASGRVVGTVSLGIASLLGGHTLQLGLQRVIEDARDLAHDEPRVGLVQHKPTRLLWRRLDQRQVARQH